MHISLYLLLFNILFLLISTVKCHGKLCDTNMTNIATGENLLNSTVCESSPCINRFCSNVNDILIKWKNQTDDCRSLKEAEIIIGRKINLTRVNRVYKKNLEITGKAVTQHFKNVKFPDETNTKCATTKEKWMPQNQDFKFYIIEDGSLLTYFVKKSESEFKEKGTFIVEFMLKQLEKNGKWIGPIVVMKSFEYYLNHIVEYEKISDSHETIKSYYVATGLLVSCFFMALVLLVYCLFSQLRTLAGLILMAHVFTLIFGFLLKSIQQFLQQSENMPEAVCFYTSIIMYFAFLSSFFWMNVMSFDIWWTFRSSFKHRPINRRGVVHKFCMYTLYGFGVPFIMTTMAILVDVLDKRNTLHIVKPDFKNCLHDSNLLYIYIPITILIIINFIFFLLSTFNIWRIRRSVDVSLKDNANKKNQSRYILYIKLFMITGFNWLMDLICTLTSPPYWLEVIADTYNMLTGVIIFGVYIFKRQIFILLSERFPICARVFKILKLPQHLLKSNSTKMSDVKTSNRNNSLEESKIDTNLNITDTQI